MKGIVFDIQRFALNDGPGIRTSIFLKGCPLACLWCHNKESVNSRPQLRYYPEKCMNCGDCVEVCPEQAHYMKNGKHYLNFSACKSNFACVQSCAYGALNITGKEMSSSELIEIALKDNSFYKSSGGGITISGGEPLVQPGFCIDILTKAKHNDLHTCLDTSGFVAENTLKESLDYTDIYLYDIKETDDNLHIKYTGQSNTKILSNLKMLNANNASIILRCPIIPGLNDREDHFRKIADISSSISNLKGIHILPYHTMGNNKAGQLGMKSGIFSVPGAEEKIHWDELLTSFGILNAEVK